jgi:hypothetical protein
MNGIITAYVCAAVLIVALTVLTALGVVPPDLWKKGGPADAYTPVVVIIVSAGIVAFFVLSIIARRQLAAMRASGALI